MSTKSLTIHDVPSFDIETMAILADVLLSNEDELFYIDDHQIINAVCHLLFQFQVNLKLQNPGDESFEATKALIEQMNEVATLVKSHYLDNALP